MKPRIRKRRSDFSNEPPVESERESSAGKIHEIRSARGLDEPTILYSIWTQLVVKENHESDPTLHKLRAVAPRYSLASSADGSR